MLDFCPGNSAQCSGDAKAPTTQVFSKKSIFFSQSMLFNLLYSYSYVEWQMEFAMSMICESKDISFFVEIADFYFDG